MFFNYNKRLFYKQGQTMKKQILALGIALLAITGCKDIGENADVNDALKGAPDWVIDGSKDNLSATGSAKIKNGNIGFATTQASASARAELAGQIATRIESKYRELTTSGEDSVNQEAVRAVRQSVDQVLTGTKVTKKWVSKDGVLWVLVQVEKLDTKLLKDNLLQLDGLNQEAAKALAQSVDELIDGPQAQE